MADRTEPDPKPDATPEPGPAPGLEPDAGRGAAMRRALLRKLPPLDYHGTSVLAALELDTDSDLRGAIELDADAFLEPLELTTRRRR
jgi:hypothetical protein